MQGQPDNIHQYDDAQEELRDRDLVDSCRDWFVADAAHGDDQWATTLFDCWLEDGLHGAIDRDVTEWVNSWLKRH